MQQQFFRWMIMIKELPLASLFLFKKNRKAVIIWVIAGYDAYQTIIVFFSSSWNLVWTKGTIVKHKCSAE